MAQVHRRATSAGDFSPEHNNRRKSGIFFFNRSFKKSSSSSKTEQDSTSSTPTTPTLGPVQDAFDLKRTDTTRSISDLAQVAAASAQGDDAAASKPAEDLPTPPDTPGGCAADDEAEAASETAERSSGEVLADAAIIQEAEAEADTSTPQQPQVEVAKTFHNNANLYIKVHDAAGQEAIYSVRAGILDGASSVWSSGIASSETTTTTIVDLTADPVFGLDVLLSIAHYRFQDLPSLVSISELHQIAVTANKYETLHLLSPFVKDWLACVQDSDAQQAHDEALVTGCILGSPRLVARSVASCAYASSLGADGALLDSRGQPWHTQPLPAEAIELLAALRLSALERIISAVSRPVLRLLDPQSNSDDAASEADAEPVSYCHAPGGDDSVREDCEQVQLGSAIMGLTKAKLWPPPAAARVDVSPVRLAHAYGEVRLRTSAVADGHAQCGFGHQKKFDAVLGTEWAELGSAIVEQLAVRAKRSGAYEAEAFSGFEDKTVEAEKQLNEVVEEPVEADAE
ncbi:hypothetical protein BD289DRAFT_443410 [Coniella lustricola]|uniref:Uncharacterized protein n=1 Tax=Coniella lustricola TaxID=2025994 RepID=A0A2T2ZX33_9PEZI|nr:hypothetical protein BD289DRAFT_443410 [Coniella lustricola]